MGGDYSESLDPLDMREPINRPTRHSFEQQTQHFEIPSNIQDQPCQEETLSKTSHIVNPVNEGLKLIQIGFFENFNYLKSFIYCTHSSSRDIIKKGSSIH